MIYLFKKISNMKKIGLTLGLFVGLSTFSFAQDGHSANDGHNHAAVPTQTTAPASTVAIYSGRGASGTLTIIGKKGRVADADGLSKARIGTGNIVDGPALEWLGKLCE